MRKIFGDAIIDQVGPVWGVDGEGELKNCYRPTGHPGVGLFVFINSIT
jgi:hypothetical protein